MARRATRGQLRLVEPEDASRSPVAGVVQGAEALPQEWAADRASSGEVALVRPLRSQLDVLPDGQLVALACEGEMLAFEVLYRRHVVFAIHLATRIEGSSRDVEDIVHDAFLRAFERLASLADRAAFKSWIGSIVVHAVRSRMRRARFLSFFGLGAAGDLVDLDAIASPTASPHARAELAQVYALLRTLPADDRIAWTLRVVDGHDLDTTARLTRCSLATVKRRIARTQSFLDDHFIRTDGESLASVVESDEGRTAGLDASEVLS